MNLWHDISPERMQPEDFLAVIREAFAVYRRKFNP